MSEMGKRSAQKMTPEQRSERARKAGSMKGKKKKHAVADCEDSKYCSQKECMEYESYWSNQAMELGALDLIDEEE